MKDEQGELCPFNKMVLIVFERNLKQIKYSKEGIYSLVTSARDHLFWIQKNEIKIMIVTTKEIKQYFDYLQAENKLSKEELIITKSALMVFYTYLAMPSKLGINPPDFRVIKFSFFSFH